MAEQKQNISEKKPTQHLSAEQKQREKEREEREKKEEVELKKKLEEKQKKRKEKEKRIAAKKKKESKRVKSLINLPFKLHIQISLLITILSAIILFFGLEIELLKTIYITFLIFTIFYLGTGIIMVGVFFLVSEEKLAEAEELRKKEEETIVESKSKYELEVEEMAKIEKEIASRKKATKMLREENADNFGAKLENNFDIFEDIPKNTQKLDFNEGTEAEQITKEESVNNETRLEPQINNSIFDESDEFMEIDFEDNKNL